MMVSLLESVQAFACESEVQEHQIEDEFRMAMGAFNFHGKLGNEGKAILRSLMYEKEQLEEDVDD